MRKSLRLLALAFVLATGFVVGVMTAPTASAKLCTAYTCTINGSTYKCCVGQPCICDGCHHNICQ